MRSVLHGLVTVLVVAGLLLAPALPVAVASSGASCCADMPSRPCSSPQLDEPLMACCKPSPAEHKPVPRPSPVPQATTATPPLTMVSVWQPRVVRLQPVVVPVFTAKQSLFTQHSSLLI